jgi:hypothetical protein
MLPRSEGGMSHSTSVVGVLFYLTNVIRPDITDFVGHLRAVKRMLAYLKGICNLGILYMAIGEIGQLVFVIGNSLLVG